MFLSPDVENHHVYRSDVDVGCVSCLPSFAFFRLAKVPPSFPKKESSFFLEDGDLGVGDLGEEGDF